MGSLYRRGDVWWIKYSVNGRPTRESARTDKRGEALRLLKDREGKALMGLTAIPRVERILFSEIADNLIQHYTVTGTRNITEAASKLAPVRRYFDGYRIPNITLASITAYQEKRLSEGLSPASINRELSTLRTALRLAHDRGLLIRIPRFHRLKESAPRAGFFEQPDFERVRRELSRRPDLQLAITLGFTLGWRVQSEILPLTLRQIDLTAGTIRLEPGTTKNKEGRIVYLTPELSDMIAGQIDRVKALSRSLDRVIPHLFPHLEKGRFQGLPLRVFKRAWQGATKRAGLPNMLVHDLRRTGVRNLVRSGVSETVAMKITGHKTRSVFDRYDIISDRDLRDAAKKIAGHNSGTVAPLSPSTASISPRSSSTSN